MARPRTLLDTHGDSGTVYQLLKTEPPGWRRERLLAIRHGLEAMMKLEEIAQSVGRSRSTIQLWFDAFRRGGIESLLSKSKGNGPRSTIPDHVLAEMTNMLRNGAWRTAPQACEWLRTQHNITISQSRMYFYLGKLGGRLKVPRPTHQKKDPQASEAFRTTLAQKLEELEIAPHKKVRVWVQDEMRYGLQPVTRRAWALRGVRVHQPVCPRFQWGYTYGALEVGGTGCEFTYLPGVNKELTEIHLQQIAQSDPEAVHVLIWDGAGFHHQDGDPAIPENLRLIRLPAYSPELNPIEKLWDLVKDSICNQLFDSLDDLERAITERLRLYWEQPQRVASLIGDGWLLSEVNAT